MKISPPEELLEPLNIETRLLLTAGPSNIHEEIIEKTFKLPVSSIVDPQYFQVSDPMDCNGLFILNFILEISGFKGCKEWH